MSWIMQGVREGDMRSTGFAALEISTFLVSQKVLDRRWSGHSADLDLEVQIHLAAAAEV